jgi:hypothetical protein
MSRLDWHLDGLTIVERADLSAVGRDLERPRRSSMPNPSLVSLSVVATVPLLPAQIALAIIE